MPRGPERLRRKGRGQFITPPALAEQLAAFTEADLARAGLGIPPGDLLDPACGDGVFLDVARRRGWGDRICGVDLDPDVIDGPKSATLAVGDGLVGESGRFGVVVGNPPFGRGLGARGEADLRALAARYEGWRADRSGCPRPAWELDGKQLAIFGRASLAPLFAERFVDAARPGGVIAMLLPESFFASRRDRAARAWMLRHARCLSVTTVYGRDFLRTGTRARTCWSVWVRREEALPRAGDCADPGVWMRQPRDEEDHELAATPGSAAFEAQVAVSEMLAVGRWDPRFFDPSWDDPLRGCTLPVRPLGDFVHDIVYGALGRGTRPEPHAEPGGFLYVGQKTLTERGVVPERCPRITQARPFVQERYTLRPGDLVVPRSGMGTLGKNLLTRWDGVPEGCDADGAVVDCFNDRVVLRGISSAWVLAVLRSRQGWWQIRRVITGVAQPNLSFVQLKALRIPVPPDGVQKEAERRWQRIRDGAPFECLRELVQEACASS